MDVERSIDIVNPVEITTEIEKKKLTKKPGRIDEVHSIGLTCLVGGILCFNSGWINAVAFIPEGFGGGVTHVTGSSTKVGWFLAHSEYTMFWESLGKVATFLLGAMISGGYLGGSRTFKGGPRYAHLLYLVSILTFASYGAARGSNVYTGAILLSIASGCQNAMTTQYSSAIVRTTHVTGAVTDIGVEFGKMLFQRDFSGLWKAKLLCTFWLSYVTGGAVGAAIFMPVQKASIMIPAVTTSLLATVYMLSLNKVIPSKGSKNGFGLHAESNTNFCDSTGTGQVKLEDK